MTEKIDISRLKILIAEDNVHFSALLRSTLHALGVEDIEEARDGSEALEVLRSYPADLVIVDWKMDGIDGVECTRLIRAGDESPNRFLPIIMLTGYTEKKLIRSAGDAGVNNFLAKPISASSLLSRITSVLSQNKPFVDDDAYFGPDRRCRQVKFSDVERRSREAALIHNASWASRSLKREALEK